MFETRFLDSALADLEFLKKLEQRCMVTTPDGREPIVSEIDDFDEEIEAASQSRELMELLAERSMEKSKGGHSLAEVKKRLGLD